MKRALLFLLLGACGTGSGTRVQGDIKQDTTWKRTDCPILVTGNVNVRSGSVLSIEGGCAVRFKPGTALSVAEGTSERGVLRAIGTKNDPIVFSSESTTPQIGDWVGLRFFDGNADKRTRLENVKISGAGSGDNGAAIYAENAVIDMTSVSISGARKSGIVFGPSAGFSATTSGISVTQAQEYGFSVSAAFAHSVPQTGSTYAGNMLGAAEIYDSEVLTSQSWHNIGLPWFCREGLAVGGSAAVLTLEAGVIIEFAAGKTFTVGSYGSAGLRAQGAAGLEVQLRAKNGERGGWGGLIINPSSGKLSTLAYTAILQGGDNAQKGALVINGASPSLQNVTVSESSHDGIVLSVASANQVAEFATGSLAIIANNNSEAGLRLPANSVGSLPTTSDCVFSGNGAVRKSQTWPAQSVPYQVKANLQVGTMATTDTVLTLKAGVSLAFAKQTELSVGVNKARGALKAKAPLPPKSWPKDSASPT